MEANSLLITGPARGPITIGYRPASPRKSRLRRGVLVALLLHVVVVMLLVGRLSKTAPVAEKAPISFVMVPIHRNARNVAGDSAVSAVAQTAIAQTAKVPARPKPRPRSQSATPAMTVERHLITPTQPVATATSESESGDAPPSPPAIAASPRLSAVTVAASAGDASDLITASFGMGRTRDDGGSPADDDRLALQYVTMVSQMLSSEQRWPLMSKQMGEKGRALVRLTLARDGRVLEAILIGATGYSRLDQEARAAVMRVGRFMPMPTRLWPDRDVVVIDQPMQFGSRY